MIKISKERNIKVIDDIITDVRLNYNGEIYELKSEKSTYKSDFYIDCTGFKKLLIGKMGAEWVSHKKYLTLNSAVVFPTGDTDNYNLFTLSQAMKYGYRFRIPTWGRHGNGYIYNNNYTNVDNVKKELEEVFKTDLDIKKEINYEPGYLKDVWIKNCLSVGLSANFIEPLEASSIGMTIQQSFLIANRLHNYNETNIESYNREVENMMINVRDFVFIHYICKRNDTDFWKDVKKIEAPDTLKEKLEMWQTRLPLDEDFNMSMGLFWSINWINILYGLDLINKDNIKYQYNMLSDNYKKQLDDMYSKIIDRNKNYNLITHKQLISKIRGDK
jgi:tryptophan halogenase